MKDAALRHRPLPTPAPVQSRPAQHGAKHHQQRDAPNKPHSEELLTPEAYAVLFEEDTEAPAAARLIRNATSLHCVACYSAAVRQSRQV
jgi:hypothetical protein